MTVIVDLNSRVNLLLDKVDEFDSIIDAWSMIASDDYSVVQDFDSFELDEFLSFVVDRFVVEDMNSLKVVIDTPFKDRVLDLLLNGYQGKFNNYFKSLFVAGGWFSVNDALLSGWGFVFSDYVRARLNGVDCLSEWGCVKEAFDLLMSGSCCVSLSEVLRGVDMVGGVDVSAWGFGVVEVVLNNLVLLRDCENISVDRLWWDTVGFVNFCVSVFDLNSVDVVELFDVWFSNVDVGSRCDRVLFEEYLNMCVGYDFPYSMSLCLVDGVVLNG